ncbi:MAG: branched-chain amino acid ABC transporter permease [Thermoleophilia bacterium]|nr:branched-chain amino acid ABC transporter permease [Thermoleophilia bacterium]
MMPGFVLFLISSLTLATVYALVALALNFEAGVDGLWDLGVVSFFAAGAYAYAILTVGPPDQMQVYRLGFGLPLWIGVIGAAGAGTLVAYLIGRASLHLKHVYYLITTFAFAEVIREVLTNERWLTNGTAGMYRMAQPFKSSFETNLYPLVLLLVMVAILVVVFIALNRVTKRPFGRALNALRENEDLAATAGMAPYRYHLRSAMIAGAVAGIAGACYVWFNTVIVPQQFTSSITFVAWTVIVVGGLGNNRGAVLGAFLLILTEDVLRLFDLSSTVAVRVASARVAVIGLILMAVLRWRPRGVLPEKRPRFSRSEALVPAEAPAQGLQQVGSGE